MAQLEVDELQLFFLLLLKPLILRPLANEFFDAHVDETSGGFVDRSQPTVLAKFSTSINIASLPWKRKNGFLHVMEEILRTFDEAHIEPYLTPLLMIVVWILQNCMLNLAIITRNKVGDVGESSGNMEIVSEMPDDFSVWPFLVLAFLDKNMHFLLNFDSSFFD